MIPGARSFQTPRLLARNASIVMLVTLKALEEKITALAGAAAAFGVLTFGRGVQLAWKHSRLGSAPSKEKMRLGIEFGTVGILLSSPFAIVLWAIGYLETFAFLILVVAWSWLFLDAVRNVRPGPSKA